MGPTACPRADSGAICLTDVRCPQTSRCTRTGLYGWKSATALREIRHSVALARFGVHTAYYAFIQYRIHLSVKDVLRFHHTVIGKRWYSVGASVVPSSLRDGCACCRLMESLTPLLYTGTGRCAQYVTGLVMRWHRRLSDGRSQPPGLAAFVVRHTAMSGTTAYSGRPPPHCGSGCGPWAGGRSDCTPIYAGSACVPPRVTRMTAQS